MPNNISSVQDYSIKATDQFFFDNNIWMYLLCPLGNFNAARQKEYSKFLNYIQERGNHICLNSLVLSEFSNRYLRLEFDLVKMDPKNAGLFNNYKKDFVGSAEFKKTVTDIKIQMKNILKMCERFSDEFNHINFDEVLNLFSSIGFNDSYYLHFAKRKGLIIVTDDSDFVMNKVPYLGVRILTFMK